MAIRTKKFSLDQIYTVFNNITGVFGNDVYYVFAGNPQPWPDDSNPPAVFESMQDSVFQTQNNMMFGKKINATNLRMMINRYNWVSNTVYDYYRDTNINLYDSQFFVITDENKCYKSLYNNQGAPSTVKPTLTQNNAFSTSDGYVWKYMFTVSSQDMSNFATPSFFPSASDSNTVMSAHTGIDVVELTATGSGYVCYVNGTVQGVVSSNTVQIDNYASQDNDFYTSSAFYVTGGPGAGQLRQVTKYVSNTSGNFAVLNTDISIIPILSKYRISPYVNIVGDGTGCQVICDVNEYYAIANVQVISTGNGYSRAQAIVTTNTAYGTGANLQAYVAPPGGHGSNPSFELGADTFGVNVVFNGSEGNTIPTASSYRRYGVLMNPKTAANSSVLYTGNTFSNVMQITTSPAINFRQGEVLSSNDSTTQAYVISSNTSLTQLIGEKTFTLGQQVVAQNGLSTSIASIITPGDIDPTSPDILYINNSTPIPRNSSNTETIKLLFTI